MKKDEKKLSDFFLFSGLDDEQLEKITKNACIEAVEYSPKSEVYSPLEYRKSIGLIVSGSVSVYKLSGTHATLLNVIGAGEIFGLAAMFSDKDDYPTTVRAKGKTKIIFISEENLCRIMTQYPVVSLNYIKFLSQKIRFLNDKIDSFTRNGAESKTAKFLLDRSAKQNSDEIIVKNMSAAASYIGTARASLYRILESLADKGVINYTGNKIKIINKSYLERLN